MALSTLTLLCNHYHYSSPEYFNHPIQQKHKKELHSLFNILRDTAKIVPRNRQCYGKKKKIKQETENNPKMTITTSCNKH